ncbi:hypothetical protein Patl1_34874 [Pistacia atlantica]|uniref:Uncharacterized protein n=1 Tax=Pistacia atlantica TaxID=434234 RepID=A0ACC0ZSB5_9ROSI|nr:hypothetical protein Patl1_34874 [Pistacia atlantica]
MVPISYDDWRHVPEDLKRKIWDFVCEHFGVNPKSQKKKLQDIGSKVETFSTKQKEKQAKNKYNHILSWKGYTNLIEEIKQETRLIEEEIDRCLTWKLTRKSKGGSGSHSGSDLESKATIGLLETDGKNDILSQALGTKEHPGFPTNIVAKGTIMEYEGPNVWVNIDVVFDGSPSLPFPDDEEFLVKVDSDMEIKDIDLLRNELAITPVKSKPKQMKLDKKHISHVKRKADVTPLRKKKTR